MTARAFDDVLTKLSPQFDVHSSGWSHFYRLDVRGQLHDPVGLQVGTPWPRQRLGVGTRVSGGDAMMASRPPFYPPRVPRAVPATNGPTTVAVGGPHGNHWGRWRRPKKHASAATARPVIGWRPRRCADAPVWIDGPTTSAGRRTWCGRAGVAVTQAARTRVLSPYYRTDQATDNSYYVGGSPTDENR